MSSMNTQHTRIPSSTLSKHTGVSRTSAMAMAGASANLSSAVVSSTQHNNNLKQVPKQYRMYLGASVLNRDRDGSNHPSISPRPHNHTNGFMIENGVNGG